MGQLGVTGGWETLYIWSAELYPTLVRNVGMGTSSAFARIGSMTAPYIAKIVSMHKKDIQNQHQQLISKCGMSHCFIFNM